MANFLSKYWGVFLGILVGTGLSNLIFMINPHLFEGSATIGILSILLVFAFGGLCWYLRHEGISWVNIALGITWMVLGSLFIGVATNLVFGNSILGAILETVLDILFLGFLIIKFFMKE